MTDKRNGQTIEVRFTKPSWISLNDIWPGCSIHILHRDKTTGLLAALFKFEPDTRLPEHFHPSDGHGLILQGTYVVGSNEYGPWSYNLAPAFVVHGSEAKAGPEGYIAFGLWPSGSGIYEEYLDEK
ncbi:MAG: hypothetical protein FJY58_10285 [Betaproteobacteria bacterium]|nr:hypothetical protein [Betaproteobacteria bacterium]